MGGCKKDMKQKKIIFAFSQRPVFWVILLIVLLIPTVVRMIQPGIYSMQDFPYFRVVQYTKCIQDGQIPCRWAPDAGLGYGEPVFNFYAPLPFFVSAIMSLLGLGALVALKFTFALTLVASGLSMYVLSLRLWRNNLSALLSAILYVYAPYRAVNVWVRGALPEAAAFIFFPLIILFFEKFLESKKSRDFILFSLSLTLLVLTHNLSVILFSLVLAIWIVARLTFERKWSFLPWIIVAGIISLCLSAFYWLPAFVESPLVRLDTTTVGYFDFRAHFVTVPQIFLSQYWGYGGSTWGNGDGLSLAVGPVQWIAALCIFVSIAISYFKTKKIAQTSTYAILLSAVGFLYLLLMHNKTAPFWEAFSPVMKYIQFPWRFLGVSLFSLSLSIGVLPILFKKRATFIVCTLVFMAIALNTQFFREDLWRSVTDTQMQTGDMWVEQTRASIGDYWPIYGPIPSNFRQFDSAEVAETIRRSNHLEFAVSTSSATERDVELPATYFPGWTAQVDNEDREVMPSEQGLIAIKLSGADDTVTLNFINTPIRSAANITSLLGIVMMGMIFGMRTKIFNEKK